MNWLFEGRAWVVGDDVGIDTHIMTLRATRERIFDPGVLSSMIFEESFPEITENATPGDIIVGGRRFAHGNPHIGGWIGMTARGVGVICSSIARGSYRNAINAGTCVLVGDGSLQSSVNEGQGIAVDFQDGLVELDSGEVFHYPPLAPELREIVGLGGSQAWARHIIKRRNQTGVFQS